MTAHGDALIDEVLSTGTLKGLPQGHFIGGRFVKALVRQRDGEFRPRPWPRLCTLCRR